jgi:HEPN domain-containing protein
VVAGTRVNRIVVLNEFASLFRAIADEDYISARSNYQLRLREQFFWAALQALEKYLKAILLYNQLTTRGYGHDLIRLYEKVRMIGWLKCSVPPRVQAFLERARALGDNRYMSTDTYVRRENLIELDESVWNIRPYCQFVRVKAGKQRVDLTDHYVRRINERSKYKEPREYEPFPVGGGFLEEVLSRSAQDPVRRALVRHNRFYGTRGSKIVPAPYWSSSRIPPNRRPWFTADVKQEIEQYIFFPKGRNDIFMF